MNMQQKFDQLKALVALAEEDMIKYAHKGNKSAGTRMRKSLQDIKEISTELRKEVLESRKIKV